MKRLIRCLVILNLFFPVIQAAAKPLHPGDTGSATCREIQRSVQDDVSSGQPFRNHGQMMKTVTSLANQAKQQGDITGRCEACILGQFAQRVPVMNQVPCGPDPVQAACCLPDGSCEPLSSNQCTDAGGETHEPGTVCSEIRCSFTYEISSEVRPQVTFLPDPQGGPDHPVAAYQDENGVVTDFLADEVILTPKSQTELDAFLTRYGGTLVGDDRVPEPPPELGIPLAPEYAVPTEYAVRVTVFPEPADFQSLAWQRGARGSYRFSSEAGVRLLALATREKLGGMTIQPSWVTYGSEMLHKTEEMLLPDNTYANPMIDFVFHGPEGSYNSNRSSIYKAWQFLAASGLDVGQSVGLAVLDDGFWLDGAGACMETPVGIDLPSPAVQYDFAEDDYFAGGANLGTCSGGSSCPWHGNSTASVSSARINNQAGIAGSGGQVAQPYLFRTYDQISIRRAVRTLIPWQARVANMSFGMNCNEDCVEWNTENNYYLRYQEAMDAGIILVAAAGNDGVDVDANRCEPCTIPGVICVGALENYINIAKGYSNYGAGVDIWAPTDVRAIPNGDHPEELTTAGGTSAASPLVAGVVAMMKAADPALTAQEAAEILRTTSWKLGAALSSDPKVQGTGYLNAYSAVLYAAGWDIFDDANEPDDTPSAATALVPGHYEELTLDPADWDYYRFTLNDYASVQLGLEYMAPMGAVFFTLTPETATGAPAGVSQRTGINGFRYTAQEMPPGTYRLLISASTPHYYFLDFAKTETGLQPDEFEANNTEGTATQLLTTSGSWELNLHQETDDDYFLIEIPNLPILHQRNLRIENADLPVTAALLDPVTLQVVQAQTGTSIEYVFQPEDSARTYLLRITGPYTRYLMECQTRRPDNPWGSLLAYDPLWWIYDPSAPVVNPYENILTQKEDWIVFTPGSAVGAGGPLIRQINLLAEGLGMRLYDDTLALVREGIALDETGAYTGDGERIDTDDLVPGRPYLLQVYRSAGAEEPADGSMPVLPQMPYSVQAVY
jgi:hypothetical protein